VGPEGIQPASETLSLMEEGPARYWRAPTLCWWVGTNGSALSALTGTGIMLSVMLLAGVLPGLACVLLWAVYLSLVAVGSVFFSFQWDILLLETLALAAFVAPWKVWAPGLASDRPPSRVAVWLLRLLLFKLVFMSGVVKLTSGDPTWRDLSALEYHFWTTCLPVWVGWHVHWMPEMFHRVSTALMFVAELGVPFLVFTPSRFRAGAAVLITLLQLGIAATGNYGFFNLLTVVLCLMLVDDSLFGVSPGPPGAGSRKPSRWGHGLAWTMMGVFVMLSGIQMQGRFAGYDSLPRFAIVAVQAVQPFRTINGYGLFANMTTVRREIVVEGSNDGKTWTPYEFQWKPGDPDRRPEFVQPHMPRLDWQMWFAALGSPRSHPWFISFMRRVGEGSPPVLGLLGSNPFPERPPRYLRAVVWDYRFAEPSVREASGSWWVREEIGAYCPVLDVAR
jgi:hypothetical protein